MTMREKVAAEIYRHWHVMKSIELAMAAMQMSDPKFVERYYEEADAILTLVAEGRAKLVEALRSITNHPHNAYYDHGEKGMYGIGVTDGHRCAAAIARDALAEEEARRE